MMLEFRSDLLHLQMFDIIHKYDCMRISHRNTSHLVFCFIHKDRNSNRFRLICDDRNLRRCQDRTSHVHSYQNHFSILYSQIQIFNPAQCLHRNMCLIGKPIIIDIFCHTTNSVSTHLSPGTVCIIHLHLKICFLGRIDQNQSIRTDSKIPVAHFYSHFRRIFNPFFKTIHIDIIIAQPLHFCKFHPALSFLFRKRVSPIHWKIPLCYRCIHTLNKKFLDQFFQFFCIPIKHLQFHLFLYIHTADSQKRLRINRNSPLFQINISIKLIHCFCKSLYFIDVSKLHNSSATASGIVYSSHIFMYCASLYTIYREKESSFLFLQKFQNLFLLRHGTDRSFSGCDQRCCCIGKCEHFSQLFFRQIFKIMLQNII